jgi:hypothetical protein
MDDIDRAMAEVDMDAVAEMMDVVTDDAEAEAA